MPKEVNLVSPGSFGRRGRRVGLEVDRADRVKSRRSFQRLAQELPLERILTETDCPYMGPDTGQRNEPANLPRAVAAIAKARGMDAEEMKSLIRENFRALFGC